MNFKYKTQQRDLIYTYILENKDRHITADEVIFHFKNNDIKVGSSTIYRFFNDLLEENILIKIGAGCYQLVENNSDNLNFYHFVCDECNSLLHVKCENVNDFFMHMQESHKFKVNNIKTVFYGVCNNCLEKKEV